MGLSALVLVAVRPTAVTGLPGGGLQVAELAEAKAVLKLRAVRSNGDFDAYWQWHLGQERRRVHAARYADGVIPLAA